MVLEESREWLLSPRAREVLGGTGGEELLEGAERLLKGLEGFKKAERGLGGT